MFGAQEWFVIFLLVLLVFGAKRVPELARALGKAKHEFKKAQQEIIEDEKQDNKKEDV